MAVTKRNSDRSASQSRSSRRDPGSSRESRARKSTAARRYSSDRGMPPVMVRGGAEAFGWQVGPKNTRQKARPRRRYDVTLNVPGAEMRLPAIPEVHLGWRVVSLGLVVMFGLLLYHLMTSPLYQVESAEITGLQRLSARDVNLLLGLTGQPVFNVDAAALVTRLEEEFPEFASAAVEVGFPDRVVIQVEERQPILTWVQDGVTRLVDAQGMAFPLRNLNDQAPALVVEAHGAPVIVGEPSLMQATEEFLPVDLISAIVSISAHAPQGTPIVYDPSRGLGWRDTRGYDIYFGDIRDMDVKVHVFNAIVTELDRQGLTPRLISVEHVNNPYYRLEP